MWKLFSTCDLCGIAIAIRDKFRHLSFVELIFWYLELAQTTIFCWSFSTNMHKANNTPSAEKLGWWINSCWQRGKSKINSKQRREDILQDKKSVKWGDIRTILKAVPNFEETLEKLDWRKCQNEYDRNVKLYTEEGEAYRFRSGDVEQLTQW